MVQHFSLNRYLGNEMLKQDIVGVWQLVSCEGKSSDGQSFLPYGSHPTGKLIYTEDGYMSVVLTDSTRPRFFSEDISQASSDEVSTAFRSFDAYSGIWELDSKSGKIDHAIEAGRIPNWVGARHARFISISEGLLTLSTDEFTMGQKIWRVYVSWRRPHNNRMVADS
jgi:hypothetical protein